MTQVVIRKPTWAEIFQASVTLTDAQIKALRTTPVLIVAAPGVGKIIAPLFMLLSSSITAAYTNIDVDENFLRLETITGEEAMIVQAPVADPLLVATSGRIVWGPPRISSQLHTHAAREREDFENRGLQFRSTNSGDYTGGHAANTLKVTVLYAVIDV